MLEIRIALKEEINEIDSFFKKYINEKTDGIFGYELLCPYGLKWAVIRKQVVIVKENNIILGFLRFYPRKRDKIVSVYQFALNEKIRGMGIIKKCLEKIGFNRFEIQCEINCKFNDYYLKTGWSLYRSDEKFNFFEIVS